MRLLLLQLACALAMTGLIWFVQVAHYPLFALVAREGFARYEAEHARRTAWVVGPLMCVELAAALFFLLPRFRPPAVHAASAWAGAALVLLVWASTALIQVPLHHCLAAGYDAGAIARLFATNWIRTIAWTTRSALLLVWTYRVMH